MSGPFVILGIVVLFFAGYAVLRFLDCVRESREQAKAIERWWAERAKYRADQSETTDSDRGPRAV